MTIWKYAPPPEIGVYIKNRSRGRGGCFLSPTTLIIERRGICRRKMTFSRTAFYITVLHLIISTTHAQRCPRGSFIDGDSCKLCPLGSYSNSFNSTSCTLCPAGTYYPFRGGKAKPNCLRCPSDTFSPTIGATSASTCKPCPPGSYSQGAAERCLRCAPGLGSSIFVSTQCVTCFQGTYNDGTMKFCAQCPSGTRANRGNRATGCVLCERGTFRDMRYIVGVERGKWRCDDCPKNTYNNKTGTQQCALCPLGSIAGTGATQCEPCPRDTFRGHVRRTRCLPCPEGTVSEPGSAACKKQPKGCPFDTFEDENGACRACLPGEKLDESTMQCVACARDEVSRGGDTTTCMKCPAGQEPVSNVNIFEKSQCVCKLGFIQQHDGSCSPCPAGRRGSVRPSGSLRSNLRRAFKNRKPFCTDCEVGSTAVPGSAQCTACPPGEIGTTAFQDSPRGLGPFYVGPAFCSKCPTGTIPNTPLEPTIKGTQVIARATKCRTKKHFCEPGEVRNDNGQCERIGRRCKWPERFDGVRSCLSCNSATFWNTTIRQCRLCPEGSVNEVTKPQTRTRCTVCQNNAELFEGRCRCKTQFVKVGKLCKPCRGNLVYMDGKCVPCQPGLIPRLIFETTEENDFFPRLNNVCSPVCSGNNIFSEDDKKCVPCPVGFKKMRDVVGNFLNKCAPVDPYA